MAGSGWSWVIKVKLWLVVGGCGWWRQDSGLS